MKTVTKDELYQLRHLKREIYMLEEEQKTIQREMKSNVSDSVSASSTFFPYVKRSVTIQGIPVKAIKKCDRIQQAITRRRQKCIDEYERLNDFIAEVPDSEMRQILTLYYVNCLSWQQVAFKVGKTDESYPRQKCEQFLKVTENTGNSMII